MTDLWDKLCAELSKAIWEHPRSYVATRFDRVKAEGDRLQDELQRYKNSFHIIKLAGGKEVELAQKLEAVKTWLKNAKAQGRISMSDGMKLDETLEVEDLQNIGETQA